MAFGRKKKKAEPKEIPVPEAPENPYEAKGWRFFKSQSFAAHKRIDGGHIKEFEAPSEEQLLADIALYEGE